MPVNKYLVIGFIALILGVLGTVAYNYYRSHPDIFSEPNYKPYQDSIASYKKDFIKLQSKVDSLNKANDSLASIKNKIDVQYYAKIKLVPGYNLDELDSTIRANY